MYGSSIIPRIVLYWESQKVSFGVGNRRLCCWGALELSYFVGLSEGFVGWWWCLMRWEQCRRQRFCENV